MCFITAARFGGFDASEWSIDFSCNFSFLGDLSLEKRKQSLGTIFGQIMNTKRSWTLMSTGVLARTRVAYPRLPQA